MHFSILPCCFYALLVQFTCTSRYFREVPVHFDPWGINTPSSPRLPSFFFLPSSSPQLLTPSTTNNLSNTLSNFHLSSGLPS
ncbi:hypothetical protein ACN38_g9108 [Penicillium nordicum]|uniref:Secreted protein n=1 Tax=Penicillium nordicum TaxID=229535 RepID=A0A0M8NYR1_9EURO|nr:hypothetical protein ACN38_g9108 [Penicillium nordicum]